MPMSERGMWTTRATEDIAVNPEASKAKTVQWRTEPESQMSNVQNARVANSSAKSVSLPPMVVWWAALASIVSDIVSKLSLLKRVVCKGISDVGTFLSRGWISPFICHESFETCAKKSITVNKSECFQGGSSGVSSHNVQEKRTDEESHKGYHLEPGGITVESVKSVRWIDGYTMEDIAKLQKDDPDLSKIIEWLKLPDKPNRDIVAAESPATRHLWLMWDQLMLQDGVLYRKYQTVRPSLDFKQLIVPKDLYAVVLKATHDAVTAGHLGVNKTITKTQKCFYWYRMKDFIRNWIRKCVKCGSSKRPRKKPKSSLGTYAVGAPMDRMVTDILGPYPVTENSNRYILIAMDCFTHWVEAYAIPDFSAQTVAHKLVMEFFSRFGMPLELHSDQGRNYESKLFKELCSLLEIHKTRTTPYRPSSNGMCERFNQTLLSMIKIYVDRNQRNWDKYLPLLTAAYRACDHSSTNFSPNLLMFGREVHLPISILLGESPSTIQDGTTQADYVSEIQTKMSEIFHYVRQNVQKSMKSQRKDYNTRIAVNNYKAGDLVYCLDETRTVGLSPKLKSDPWKGPFVIVRKISDILFEIKGSLKGNLKVIHHDRLKPYISDDVPSWVTTIRNKHVIPADSTRTKDVAITANLDQSEDRKVDENTVARPISHVPSDKMIQLSGQNDDKDHDDSMAVLTVQDGDNLLQDRNPSPRRSLRQRKTPNRLNV